VTEQRLRILHVSTSDGVWGAGRAAYRLHLGLRCLGHDSLMFVANRHSGDPSVVVFRRSTSVPGRAVRRLRRMWAARSLARHRLLRDDNMTVFSDDRVEHLGNIVGQMPSCDVVNLHWVTRFVDYRSFFAHTPLLAPIVWTLHDMNAFTGGCHCTYDCERYMDGCGACPQLGSSTTDDMSHSIWQAKQEIMKELRPDQLHIVTPSRWLAIKAERSTLLRAFSVSHIPNCVDTGVFSPRNRRSARQVLNIPQEARVVLFVAQLLHRRHKGFNLLSRALSGLRDVPNLFLVTVGRGEPVVADHVAHLHLDRLNDDALLALAYSAADVLAIPSLQDNLPNTVLEAMSCGVPVVGFDVGGIPELVRPGVTGLLAPAGDANALSAAIGQLLQDPAKRAEMGRNCRRIAVEEYAPEVQARRYRALYERVASSKRKESEGEPWRVASTGQSGRNPTSPQKHESGWKFW